MLVAAACSGGGGDQSAPRRTTPPPPPAAWRPPRASGRCSSRAPARPSCSGRSRCRRPGRRQRPGRPPGADRRRRRPARRGRRERPVGQGPGQDVLRRRRGVVPVRPAGHGLEQAGARRPPLLRRPRRRRQGRPRPAGPAPGDRRQGPLGRGLRPGRPGGPAPGRHRSPRQAGRAHLHTRAFPARPPGVPAPGPLRRRVRRGAAHRGGQADRHPVRPAPRQLRTELRPLLPAQEAGFLADLYASTPPSTRPR